MRDIKRISIDLVKPNRYQPRSVFDDEKMIELAESIKVNGLIQPIVVRDEGDHFEIVAGERRFRASVLAGLVEVEAIVQDVSNQEMSELALVENIQRENLTAIEEARAYKILQKKFGLTQSELGKQMGKSQSTIANKLRLLNLKEDVQDAIVSRKITERHARELLRLDEDEQTNVMNTIIDKKLTVSETEKVVSKKTNKVVKVKSGTRGFSRNHQLAINTIKQAVGMVEKIGMECSMEQRELDDEIEIIIRLKK